MAVSRITGGSNALESGRQAGVALWLVRGLLLLLVGLAIPLGWLAAQVYTLERSASFALTSNLASTQVSLRPDAPITVHLAGAGAQLWGVRLYRADASAPVTLREQPVAVRAVPLNDAGDWQVLALDGKSALRAGGSYRLVVHASALRPALPLPRHEIVERQYYFSTVAAPQPLVPTGVLRPGWGEPVLLDWSLPIASVEARVQPPAPLEVQIDPQDATRTWIQLGGADFAGVMEGATYEVLFTSARDQDGIGMLSPASIRIAVPTRPRIDPQPTAPVTVQRGEEITFRSSLPLKEARVESTGSLPVESAIEGQQVRVRFPEHAYAQGQAFTLTLAEGISFDGAPIAAPVSVQVRTPDPLPEPTIEPEAGASGLAPSTRPALTFPDPIANRLAVERALTITPEVEGAWTWTSPQRVEFVPDERLPHNTEITVTLRGGPEGARSQAGGYLEKEVASTFTTAHYKVIDVSLNRQLLTMYEDDKAVGTIVVATGVRGAETPQGEFKVEYKMPQAHFRGENPSGARYDIPDVNWVLAFWGDYTIHGAHWRTRFGTPGSNGCVSMSDADAKRLYDWADVGTIIRIHS